MKYVYKAMKSARAHTHTNIYDMLNISFLQISSPQIGKFILSFGLIITATGVTIRLVARPIDNGNTHNNL